MYYSDIYFEENRYILTFKNWENSKVLIENKRSTFPETILFIYLKSTY